MSKLYGQLVRPKKCEFPVKGKSLRADEDRGVYIIYTPQGAVAHVGRTHRGKKGLTQRLKNHLYGSSSFVKSHLGGQGAKLRQGYCYKYLVVVDDMERALLEALAIGRLCPLHIGVGLTKKD